MSYDNAEPKTLKTLNESLKNDLEAMYANADEATQLITNTTRECMDLKARIQEIESNK